MIHSHPDSRAHRQRTRTRTHARIPNHTWGSLSNSSLSSSRWLGSSTASSRRRSHTRSSRTCASSTLGTWALALLATVLLGTVLVLGVVKSFFGVDWQDALSVQEVAAFENMPTLPYNSHAYRNTSLSGPGRDNTQESGDHDDLSSDQDHPLHKAHGDLTHDAAAQVHERIPRLIHQTWKSHTLPSRWASLAEHCRAMHPDFEYMLWSDEDAMQLIDEHYPWFAHTYRGYKHNIQRADALRYFVLHRFGGVYMDLDIGCRKPLHPLLNFRTILPATKPVGVSNDLMFAEPRSPFMESVIHNLVAFDHTYLSDYPTVMFSTGPMFLSAVLSLWNSRTAGTAALTPRALANRDPSNPNTDISSSAAIAAAALSAQHTVRILPRELYGKNIDPDLAPDSFFYHYYGSSWHESDSAIFTFLGEFGKQLMRVAFAIVLIGTAVLVLRRIKRRRRISLGEGNTDEEDSDAPEQEEEEADETADEEYGGVYSDADNLERGASVPHARYAYHASANGPQRPLSPTLHRRTSSQPASSATEDESARLLGLSSSSATARRGSGAGIPSAPRSPLSPSFLLELPPPPPYRPPSPALGSSALPSPSSSSFPAFSPAGQVSSAKSWLRVPLSLFSGRAASSSPSLPTSILDQQHYYRRRASIDDAVRGGRHSASASLSHSATASPHQQFSIMDHRDSLDMAGRERQVNDDDDAYSLHSVKAAAR